jgi:hypothetical protein
MAKPAENCECTEPGVGEGSRGLISGSQEAEGDAWQSWHHLRIDEWQMTRPTRPRALFLGRVGGTPRRSGRKGNGRVLGP